MPAFSDVLSEFNELQDKPCKRHALCARISVTLCGKMRAHLVNTSLWMTRKSISASLFLPQCLRFISHETDSFSISSGIIQNTSRRVPIATSLRIMLAVYRQRRFIINAHSTGLLIVAFERGRELLRLTRKLPSRFQSAFSLITYIEMNDVSTCRRIDTHAEQCR